MTKKQNMDLYRIQSIERVFDILDCFSFQNREMNLSEIVKRTGLNKTTAKRLLANLTSRDYLKQDPVSKRYHLGLRLFELGGIVFSSFSLRRSSVRPMDDLRNLTGETVLLGAMMQDQLVYIAKSEGSGMIRISSEIGWRRPLNYGILGMILMASLAPKEANRILKKNPLEAYTPNSITDKHTFFLRLEKIKTDGYVVDNEEVSAGIIGIAAPIRDFSRKVVAALGIVLPRSTINHGLERLDYFKSLIKKTSDDISTDLGYSKI